MNLQSGLGWLLLGAGAFGIIAGGGYALSESTKDDRAVIASGALPSDRTGLDAAIRDYILNHPEVIPEAMERLQNRETGKDIALHRKQIETPFAGAWAGAANGNVTLVMFTDYACGYCRASAPDIDRLLKEDPRLKVVWREIPILGPDSVVAAQVGLSAARLGKYRDFHNRLFAAGPLSEDKISATAASVAISAGQLRADKNAKDIADEIQSNLALARTLRIGGTPTFVVGDTMLQGAVGYDALKKAIQDARQS